MDYQSSATRTRQSTNWKDKVVFVQKKIQVLPRFQSKLNKMLGLCASRVLLNGGFHKQQVANQISYMSVLAQLQ